MRYVYRTDIKCPDNASCDISCTGGYSCTQNRIKCPSTADCTKNKANSKVTYSKIIPKFSDSELSEIQKLYPFAKSLSHDCFV